MNIEMDITRDYTRIQPKPYHKWSTSQHITLEFFATLYKNPWKDVVDVFNEYFASDLSSQALASMYNDMQRGRTGKEAMRMLRGTAFSFITPPTLVDQDSIERTASKLGVHLIKKLPSASSKGPKPPKMAKRKAVVLEEETDFLSEPVSTPRAPKKRQQHEPIPQTPDSNDYFGAPNGLPTPPTTVSQRSIDTPKWLPPVAYRAFSHESQGSYSKEKGFCAGAFVDSEVPLPPDPKSQDYIDEAKRVKLSPLVPYFDVENSPRSHIFWHTLHHDPVLQRQMLNYSDQACGSRSYRTDALYLDYHVGK